jgi:hypothetical protein
MDYYLRTYRKIDYMAFDLEVMMELLTKKIKFTSLGEYRERMLKKYTDLGYEDLWLDF